MKLQKAIVTGFACIALLQCAAAQDGGLKQWSLGGYVSNMQTIMDYDSLNGYWIYQSQFHNRLNVGYYPASWLSVSMQARNRLLLGDAVRMDINDALANSLEKEAGWLDLSFNLLERRSYILNTQIDRLYMKLEINKLWVTLGRQRINWGQAFVWNPNDWFNTYSFFDFDYEERAGSDAFRLQYFTGFTSSVEAAVKIDSAENITAAMLVKTNKWEYDFQFLGGILDGHDYGMGMGWSGHIRNISFRGEMSYFHPIRNFSDTTGLFFMSMGLDYMFSNSLMIQVEGLYNGLPKGYGGMNFTEYYSRPLSVKDLSFTEWNIFGQVSYPFTPLLNGTLSAMFFPKIEGFFIGPSLTWSIANNFDFSLLMQVFSGKYPGEEGTPEKHNLNFGFVRFKYNF